MGFWDWFKPKPKPPLTSPFRPRDVSVSVEGPSDPTTIRATLRTDHDSTVRPGTLTPGTRQLKWSLHPSIVGGGRLDATAPGFAPYSDRTLLPIGTGNLTPPVVKMVPLVIGRTGPVRLVGRAMADDQGAFPALGHSLFWAWHGERREPERMDLNLAYLRRHGTEFIRAVGMVGRGDYWADRVIDPHDPEYWPTWDRLFVRLKRHGLRAAISICADAQAMMPDPLDRLKFVDMWATYGNAHADQIQYFEVANEHYANGLDIPEVRRLGARLMAYTSIPVTLSAPSGGQACAMYSGSGVPLAAMHYDRSFGSDGPVRAIRQPYGWPDEYQRYEHCSDLTQACVNQEPIGIASSVKSDDDPLRLVMGYVTTFVVTHHCAHVVHSGAGVRGQKDAQREENIYDQPHIDETMAGLKAARLYLPGDIANWTKSATHLHPFPFQNMHTSIDPEHHMIKAYSAEKDGKFLVVLLGVTDTVRGNARQSMTVETLNPMTGDVLRSDDLTGGAAWSIDPRSGRDQWGDFYVLRGQLR